MPSPMTVSLEVPYSENEQQFLALAVQIAMRTFRTMHPHSDAHTLPLSFSEPSDLSSSAKHDQSAVRESEV